MALVGRRTAASTTPGAAKVEDAVGDADTRTRGGDDALVLGDPPSSLLGSLAEVLRDGFPGANDALAQNSLERVANFREQSTTTSLPLA